MNAHRLSILVLAAALAHAAQESTEQALKKPGDATFQAATVKTIADDFRDRLSVNVVVRPAEKETVPVTMHLKNVPNYIILQYVARAAGLHMRLTSFGAVFEPGTGPYSAMPPAGAFAASLRKRFSPQFEDTSLKDVIQYLAQVQGVNVVLVNPESWQDIKVSLKLGELSVLQFFTYISELYHVPVTLDRYAAVIGEKKIEPPPATEEKKRKANPVPRKP